jgi:hypothetical protein
MLTHFAKYLIYLKRSPFIDPEIPKDGQNNPFKQKKKITKTRFQISPNNHFLNTKEKEMELIPLNIKKKKILYIAILIYFSLLY